MAVRFYPNLREEMIRVVLVEYVLVILFELDGSLGFYAAKKMV